MGRRHGQIWQCPGSKRHVDGDTGGFAFDTVKLENLTVGDRLALHDTLFRTTHSINGLGLSSDPIQAL